MNDYLFLMHDDAGSEDSDIAWEAYLRKLRASGQFEGGSAIGSGQCVTKSRRVPAITSHLSGYIRVRAETLEAAKALHEAFVAKPAPTLVEAESDRRVSLYILKP